MPLVRVDKTVMQRIDTSQSVQDTSDQPPGPTVSAFRLGLLDQKQKDMEDLLLVLQQLQNEL